MPRTRSAGWGFTLIEMLVVISIIAVLAAILMPVISSVQEKARQARCTSNLLQLSSALKAYKTDFGVYPQNPYSYMDTTVIPNKVRYAGGVSALYPDYISDKAMLICPNDQVLRGIPAAQVPDNYSSYNGTIDAAGTPDTVAYWAFKGFTDTDGLNRFYVTYNYGGFDDDGWDLTSWDGTAFVYPVAGGALPQWLKDEHKKWRHYPRLKNNRAPDNTIICRCVHHQKWYGNERGKWRNPITRLGGDATSVDYDPWTRVDPTLHVSQWVMQK